VTCYFFVNNLIVYRYLEQFRKRKQSNDVVSDVIGDVITDTVYSGTDAD